MKFSMAHAARDDNPLCKPATSYDQRMRFFLPLLVATVVGVAVAVASQATRADARPASASPAFAGCDAAASVRPDYILLGCGDGQQAGCGEGSVSSLTHQVPMTRKKGC